MPADIETLKALRERVAGAKGADLELDADISVALGFAGHKAYGFEGVPLNVRLDPANKDDDPEDARYLIWETADGEEWTGEAALLTASIDAAVALVERVMPDTTILIRKSVPEHWDARQWGALLNDKPLGWSVSATPPLAILHALLTALISRQESNNAQ